MKTITKIGFTVIMLISSVSLCWADRISGSDFWDYRNSLEQVENFLRNKNFILSQESDLNSTSSYCITSFSMPEAELKNFTALFQKVMSYPGTHTYFSTVRPAGSPKAIKKFNYGDNKSKSITFGDNINQNLALAYYGKENKLPEVYAITWESKKGTITGTLYYLPGAEMDTSEEKELKTSEDVVNEFSKIRTAFKNQQKLPDIFPDKLTVQTGLAIKLAKLCKNYFHLLDPEMRSICEKAILDMRESTKDTFLQDLLDQSIQTFTHKKK